MVFCETAVGYPVLCLFLNAYFSPSMKMLARASVHKSILVKNIVLFQVSVKLGCKPSP